MDKEIKKPITKKPIRCYTNIKPVYRRTSMQKCDINFIEIILLCGYSSVNMLYICNRTIFLKNTSGELLLYIILNLEIINVEVLSKQVKNYFKYFKYFKHLSNFIRNFFLVAKGYFSEAVVVIVKSRKRGYIFGN